MKKISILIANYNNGRYFKDCFISLINQTYSNWEAIIIDDCSSDNSVKIIREHIKNDSRFSLFQNSENKGCGYTKRRCVELATGELCAFLDSDDALYPWALEYSELELEKKNLVGVYSQLAFCNENLEPQNIFIKTKQIYNGKYFFNYPIQIAHFFTFRKSTYFQTIGINPNLEKAVDQDLYLKLLEYGNVKFIPEVLYKYRCHSKGISQGEAKQDAKESFAKVIHDTMKRRGIKTINHKIIPEVFTSSNEIFTLLRYQTNIMHRLISKIKVTLGNI